ncbi:MAG: hypothetical protein PME_27350 [Priestia megaterium]
MKPFKASALLDVISELFSDEASIADSDLETYVYYRASKRINVNYPPLTTLTNCLKWGIPG